MYSNFKEQAIEYVKQAVQEDNAGNYAKAFHLYMNALEYFKTHLKYEKNPKIKEAITQKFTEYLRRAEEIRAVLDDGGPGPASNGDAAVATRPKTKPKDGEGGGGDGEDPEQAKLRAGLNSAIIREKPNVKWNDVAGLESAKQALQEAVILPVKFPQFFTGKRRPWRAFLLYGPPGTGKSYLAKAVATEADSTFFSISSSDLVSKWMGESEKLVSNLFQMARESAPSIIFIDEIDSLCGQRGEGNETEASRRIKTELLVQMQGVGHNDQKVLVLAATNTPYILDQAIRRRFDKRIYIPLPDLKARQHMFKVHLGDTPHNLTESDFEYLASRTEGFSGSDISVCVKDVLFEPVRKTQDAMFFFKNPQGMLIPCGPKQQGAVQTTMQELASKILPPPITITDFHKVLARQRPTVRKTDLEVHERFTKVSLEKKAIRRRFDKRIYIPLPDLKARQHMFKVHLGDTPHNFTESDFEYLASRTEGFSGSDISVCVKDVLFEPVRKTQDAMFFFKNPEGMLIPCGPKQQGAVQTTMQELVTKGLASKILPPPITITDFDKVLARQRPTVSKTDLEVHERFTKVSLEKKEIRRRFDKRIYIPLLDLKARQHMFKMTSQADHMESQLPEIAEHSISTTPVATDTTATLPPHPDTSSSGRRNRSVVRSHFTQQPDSADSDSKAKCNYRGCLIKYKDGTSAMKTHLSRCKKNPNKDGGSKRQRSSQGTEGKTSGGGVGSSPTYFKFDPEVTRMKLVKMFVGSELPFLFVENDLFLDFVNSLNPRFNVPSRSTLRRHILALYNEERTSLKKLMSKHCGRVCLTTDTWTSIQNLNYMCLTAHFIDNDWNLHKKILNFCQITGHSGEIIAKNIEVCLNSWELNQVLSVTGDNATSNDLGLQYLKKRLMSWNSLVLKGEYIHMRCCVHILSLIVKEGLKEMDDSILRIRSAVKYVRSSPARFARFKACAEQEKIPYKGLVCLDVETRWNSTYLMLQTTLKYRKAFDLLEMQDNKYADELMKDKGKSAPLEEDWDYAKSVLPFLKLFYDATMRISGSSYITSNIYMKEVFALGRKLRQYSDCSDASMRLMAIRMRSKYDKYWGNPNGLNILLLIAVVLDPRNKLNYVNCFVDYLFESDKANELNLKLSSSLRSLYEQYQGIDECSQSYPQEEAQPDEDDDDIHGMGFYLQVNGQHRSDSRTEIDKYLAEECEPFNKSVEFDILNWWKVNSARFPILSSMAREVLAIPVSTVASESAFSTGGRVLNPHRSNLTPKIVEMLVCTQNWLRGTPFSALSEEDLEELEKFEQEIISHNEVASSSAINLDD